MTRQRATLVTGTVWLALLMFVVAVPVCAQQPQEINRQSPPNVSELIQEVKILPDSQDRIDAARKLTTIEPLPPEAIQALAEALKTTERNGAFERYAKQALIKAGARAIPALTPLVENESHQVNEAAVETLGRIAISEPAAWPILIGTFKENSSRWGAAYELAKAGPPVVPVLRKALKDKDPRVRAGAAQALAQMGDFYRTWKESNSNARQQAGVVLASKADMAPAAPELSEALKDPDAKIRYPAALALAYADPTDQRAVPILVEILADKDAFARQAAVAALEEMGSNAQQAVPDLEHALTSDPAVSVGAARALARIAGAKACAPLAQATTDGNYTAARAMVALWPACPQTIAALIGTLGNKRYSATVELAELGKPAVPALAAALKRPDLYVREDAVKALAQMKPLPPEAVHALMVALKDESLEVSSAAAAGLRDVGGEAAQATLAERQREAQIHAQRSQPDTRRYSQSELSAAIPADADHKYPLTLAYLFPIYPRGGFAQQAKLLITLHTGKDRPERLVFWKKIGDDQYQQIKVIEPDNPDFAAEHFETPTVFFPKGQVPGEGMQFVDVPVDGYRSHRDQVFAIDGDELRPVEIQSPDEWYKDKLAPREEVWHPATNSFSDEKLEFAFAIWNSDDAMCCPSAGQVTGTYKLVKEFGVAAGSGTSVPFVTAGGMRGMKGLMGKATITWKLVVDTAEREPGRRPALPHSRKDTRNAPAGKKA